MSSYRVLIVQTLGVFIICQLAKYSFASSAAAILIAVVFCASSLPAWKAWWRWPQKKTFLGVCIGYPALLFLALIVRTTLSISPADSFFDAALKLSREVWLATTRGFADTSTFIPAFLLSVMIAPIAEEIYFRGAVFERMLKISGVNRPQTDLSDLSDLRNHSSLLRPAAFWTVYFNALLFWIFHLPIDPQVWSKAWALGGLPAAPGPFFLGLCAGFVTLRDRSLLGAVLLHAFANASGGAWSVIFSDAQWLKIFYTTGS